ncbi:MAG: hypothetical protein LWY06_16505 [Firmicutes bacterium]|nr:hypothetical protein [Bacillota bacterium]
MRKLFLFLALITIMFFSPQAGFCQQGKGGVRGVVKGMLIKNGKIIYTRLPNIKASLEFTKYSAQTGEDGRFEIPEVPEGSYTLVIEDGKGGKDTKNVDVRAGKMFNSGSTPILLPPDTQTPAIEPGSIVAVFSDKQDSRLYKRDAPMLKKGDTSTNSMVVYKPDTGKVYLEVVIEEKPLLVLCGKKPGEVYVATDQNNLEIWDLNKTEKINSFSLHSIPSHMAWNEDKSKLFISFCNDNFCGIIRVDAEKHEPDIVIVPPPLGVITCILPTGNGETIYALMIGKQDGRVVIIRKKDGKYIVEKNQKAGKDSRTITLLKSKNKILVGNTQGKSIQSFDDRSLKPLFNQPLEGEPIYSVEGLRDGKAYFTLPDRDVVAVIDGNTGRQIEQIHTGKVPWAIKRIKSRIIAANAADRTFTIIDGILDKVEKTIQPEDFEVLRDFDIIPEQ